MVRPAQFLGPLQGYQSTLPAPSRRALRVPPQPWALTLASGLRSSLAVHFLDHGRLFAADCPSTSPYAVNALLPMSERIYARNGVGFMAYSKEAIAAANKRASDRLARTPTATAARYARRRGRVVIDLSNGLSIAFRPQQAQGLEHATPDQLRT